MKLDALVTVDRVGLAVESEPLDKPDSLRRLAELLARGGLADSEAIYQVLREREDLQSTGIGDGVAVPHGTIEGAPGQIGAVLLCPNGVAFDAIDDKPARILFGVIGPRQAVEHLKVLARVSRLLRRPDFRERLLAERDPIHAYELLRSEDDALGLPEEKRSEQHPHTLCPSGSWRILKWGKHDPPERAAGPDEVGKWGRKYRDRF